ncbi:MAG: cytochrome c [Sphingobium sp.]
MRIGYFGPALALCLGGIVGTPLLAADGDPVAARIHGYRDLGSAFKNVQDELRSSTPQPYILQLSARQIRDTARQQYGWFPAGSGPRPGVKTAAKPIIWQQPAQFKAAQDALSTQANAFYQAVASGDISKVRVQAKALGQSCGACHRTYRVEEK